MSLRLRSLSFSYYETKLLADLNLALDRHGKVALVGPNGSGKSTLLKVLAGAITPDEGEIEGIAHVLHVDQHSTLTEPLSGGEKRLAALRVAFASRAEVLLLDEPTNDLDGDARQWLATSIANSPAALLIVSHDPMILDLVDEIWELRNGQIQRHPRGFLAYMERLDREECVLREEVASLRAEGRKLAARARQSLENQQKRMARGERMGEKSNLPKIIRGKLKRQAQETLGKLSKAGGERQEKMAEQISRAESRLRSLSMFEWDSTATRPPAGKVLFKLEGVKVLGGNRELTYQMVGPRRLMLKGKNGSGKSTLLRALCGEEAALQRVSGKALLSVPAKLFDQYLSQFTSDLSLWRWFQSETNLEVATARTILGALGFDQHEQERPLIGLSGGERVRLEIAVALHRDKPPQLLLLDEPTNHLDMESRRILQTFVEKFQGGVVLVSHDQSFVGSLTFSEEIDLN